MTGRAAVTASLFLGLVSGVVGGAILAALFSRSLLAVYPLSALVHGILGAVGAALFASLLALRLSPVWTLRIAGGGWVAGTAFLILGYYANKVVLLGTPYHSPASLAADGAALMISLLIGGAAVRPFIRMVGRAGEGSGRLSRRLAAGSLGLLSVVLALALAAFFSVPGGGIDADPSAPSVLLVSFDTCRADHLACYGYEPAKTPVADRLAAEGVRFESAFCPVPSTSPSHASMLTGLVPQSHGVRANAYALDRSHLTLAEVLGGAGYATGGFTTNVLLSSQFGFDQGFDTYVESGHVERIGSRRLDLMFQALIAKEVFDFFRGRWGGEAPTVLNAKKWLSGIGDRPFFLFFHLIDPHIPYSPPDPFRSVVAPDPKGAERSLYAEIGGDPDRLARTVSLYDGEIATADAKLGRLLRHVAAVGRDRNLLIVFTADHGENLGDHEPFFAHQDLFDSVLRVPLIFHFPGVFPGGLVVDRMVDNKDIVPTVLSFLGLPLPRGVQGRSLLPLIRGAEADSAGHFLANFGTSYALIRPDRKMVVNIKTGERRLFDLREDPGERENLFVIGGEEARELESQLLAEIRRVETEGYLDGEEASPMNDLDRQTRERLRALGYLD